MAQYECSICKDTRHVLKEGGWVRCSCLFERDKILRYSKAGITFDTSKLKIENAQKEFPAHPIKDDALFIYSALVNHFKNKKGFLGQSWCLQGPPASAKDFLVQCILKEAVDSGMRVNHQSMSDLIQRYFNKDEADFSLLSEFNKTDLFVISFGTEIQSKVAATFLIELLRAHNANIGKHCLMVHTHLPMVDLQRYGPEALSYFQRYEKETYDIDKLNKRFMYVSTVK